MLDGVAEDGWAAALALLGNISDDAVPCSVRITPDGQQTQLTVIWPDGTGTTLPF
ncbi:hypothetical protein [Nonomuraea sp. NPDC050310]|uniref:hypothetical protein n=1 Tax=Nonomuraea sp. NPDC050310 TaxID=3154935 RepID=UPI0034023B38